MSKREGEHSLARFSLHIIGEQERESMGWQSLARLHPHELIGVMKKKKERGNS